MGLEKGREDSPPTRQVFPADLQAVVDCVEEGLFIIDKEYRVTFANSEVRQRLPESLGTPLGRYCFDVFEGRESPCCAPLWLCPVPKVMQSGAAVEVVHRHHLADGVGPTSYSKVAIHPLKDKEGNIQAFVEVRKDVTAERELESQLLRRYHHLYSLNLISGAVSALWDIDKILTLSLGVALEIVDCEIGGILLFDSKRRSLKYRVYRGLSAKYAEKMRIKKGEGIAGRVAESGEPILVEDVSKDPRVGHRELVGTEGLKGFASVPLVSKKGVAGVINVASLTPGRFTEDDLYVLKSIGYQIGTAIEQASLYEGLARAGERYQTLLRHALSAQEEERKRIARELHDETSQSLTSLALSLQAMITMAEMRGIEDGELMARMRKTHTTAVDAGNEIVKLMKELRPTLLDELGMPSAIRRYARDTLQARGISMSEDFNVSEERFRPEVEVTLYRVAQGLIGNILEHSEARNVFVGLTCKGTECVLRIQDDGKGFDVSKLTRIDPSGRGTGLFTIKERVKLVGGTCRVESQAGRGTKVVVKVPVVGDATHEQDEGADRR